MAQRPCSASRSSCSARAPGSFGGVWAHADLKKILRTAGARVVDEELAVPRVHVRLAEDGRLLDDELRERLAAQVDSLLAEVNPRAAVAA